MQSSKEKNNIAVSKPEIKLNLQIEIGQLQFTHNNINTVSKFLNIFQAFQNLDQSDIDSKLDLIQNILNKNSIILPNQNNQIQKNDDLQIQNSEIIQNDNNNEISVELNVDNIFPGSEHGTLEIADLSQNLQIDSKIINVDRIQCQKQSDELSVCIVNNQFEKNTSKKVKQVQNLDCKSPKISNRIYDSQIQKIQEGQQSFDLKIMNTQNDFKALCQSNLNQFSQIDQKNYESKEKKDISKNELFQYKENIKSKFFPENNNLMKAINTLDMPKNTKQKQIFKIIKYEKLEDKNVLQPTQIFKQENFSQSNNFHLQQNIIPLIKNENKAIKKQIDQKFDFQEQSEQQNANIKNENLQQMLNTIFLQDQGQVKIEKNLFKIQKVQRDSKIKIENIKKTEYELKNLKKQTKNENDIQNLYKIKNETKKFDQIIKNEKIELIKKDEIKTEIKDEFSKEAKEKGRLQLLDKAIKKKLKNISPCILQSSPSINESDLGPNDSFQDKDSDQSSFLQNHYKNFPQIYEKKNLKRNNALRNYDSSKNESLNKSDSDSQYKSPLKRQNKNVYDFYRNEDFKNLNLDQRKQLNFKKINDSNVTFTDSKNVQKFYNQKLIQTKNDLLRSSNENLSFIENDSKPPKVYASNQINYLNHGKSSPISLQESILDSQSQSIPLDKSYYKDLKKKKVLKKRKSSGKKRKSSQKKDQLSNCEEQQSQDSTMRYCLCGGTADEDQKVIECSYCQVWYHIGCINLTLQEFKFYSRKDQKWKCQICIDKQNSLQRVNSFTKSDNHSYQDDFKADLRQIQNSFLEGNQS